MIIHATSAVSPGISLESADLVERVREEEGASEAAVDEDGALPPIVEVEEVGVVAVQVVVIKNYILGMQGVLHQTLCSSLKALVLT